jgi:C-terminal processing protease CtpA/Prc
MKVTKFLIALLFTAWLWPVLGQDIGFERDRRRTILELIKSDVKKNYFDPAFKGIDIESKYKEAQANIQKATSVGQLDSAIAQFLTEFDDSHLYYLPPGKVRSVDYGFDFRMFGDKCFVIQVDKGSDAEKKGLQVGDEVRSVSSFGPTRETLWKMRYFFFSLFPQPVLYVAVVKPDKRAADYEVVPKITTGRQISLWDPNQIIRDIESSEEKATRQYYYDKLPGAFIWRMPAFSISPDKVDDVIGRAKKYPAIVFDLRGNPGGRVDMVLRLIANIFDYDVKVGDEKKRKETKEVIARSRGKVAYDGKIVALIDSDSGSASEVFSKVLQIENRGTIIGDRSAGAVMESKFYPHQLGLDIVIYFGSSVTIADLIMKDGRSLEKVGVTPDVTLIPTAHDLAARRDIVMAKALETLGIVMTPEAAARIFPEADKEQQP